MGRCIYPLVLNQQTLERFIHPLIPNSKIPVWNRVSLIENTIMQKEMHKVVGKKTVERQRNDSHEEPQ